MEEQDCLFCNMISGKILVDKIKETDNFIVIRDKFPLTPGHTLIISKKHYDNLLQMPNLLGSELLNLIKETYLKLAKEIQSEGFNLIQNNFHAAGQAIDHLHFHIIPRKQNDGVKLN